jgi:hypothetical protein
MAIVSLKEKINTTLVMGTGATIAGIWVIL